MTSEIKPEDVKLPEPAIRCFNDLIGQMADGKGGFTADQVRAAVLAERERIARLVESKRPPPPPTGGWVVYNTLTNLAAAIRSGHSVTETQRAGE